MMHYNKHQRGFIAQLKAYGPFKSDDGIFLGVAKGIADYYGWSPTVVRLIFVLATLFLFFWPTIIFYLIAAMLMSPAPKGRINSPDERDIWLQAQLDPKGTMENLARKAQKMEARVRRMENYITSKDYSWSHRMNGGK